MNDDLASGFQGVDRATDFAVFSSCLTLVGSIPFFAECKSESYDLLGATPGRRILDVGYGLGDDGAAIAKLVAPRGAVVGVDSSRTMIEAARARHDGVEGLSFEIVDAAILPFEDARFDACRVDRVLQHVAEPVPVVGEMFRVLRPGGVLVAYDNDWETLTVDATDRGLTRRFERLVRPLPFGLDRPAAGPALPASRPPRRRRVPEDLGPSRSGRGRSALLLLHDRRPSREVRSYRPGGRGSLGRGAAYRPW